MRLLCPYSLKPISEIEQSIEHIIPDALGGPRGFSLTADRQINSDYGASVDAALINDPAVSMMAAQVGVTTRHGPAVFSGQGKAEPDNARVRWHFSAKSAEVRFHTPVIKNDMGEVVGVRGFGQQAPAEFERLQAAYAKKGRVLTLAKVERVPAEVHSTLQFDILAVLQGISKIAYLSSVWTYGDDYVLSSAGQLIRGFFSGERPASLDALAHTGFLVVGAERLPTHLWRCSTSQHHITVQIANGKLLTTVMLFGTSFLTWGFITPVPELARRGASLRVIRVDAVHKSYSQQDFGALAP